MLPIFYRNNACFPTPVFGFSFGVSCPGFEPQPMSTIFLGSTLGGHCRNPFDGFLGSFLGGLAGGALGSSLANQAPTANYVPRYPSFPSFPIGCMSFGSSDGLGGLNSALDGIFGNFIGSFQFRNNAAAPTSPMPWLTLPNNSLAQSAYPQNTVQNTQPQAKNENNSNKLPQGIQELNDANFDSAIRNSQQPVLVEFYADWCEPCKKQSPVIDEIAKNYSGKAQVYKINADNAQAKVKEHNVQSIPAILVFQKGQVVGRFEGVQPKATIEETLNKFVQQNSAAGSDGAQAEVKSAGEQSASGGDVTVKQTDPYLTNIIKNNALNEEASILEKAKRKGLNAEVQRYQQIKSAIEQVTPRYESDEKEYYSKYNSWSPLTNNLKLVLNAMESIGKKDTEANEFEKKEINSTLDYLAEYVKKYQKAFPIDNTSPKTETQLKTEEDTFSATCKGGECGDKNDRLYFDAVKGEWQKSTQKGYTKQPIAPMSTLVEVKDPYLTSMDGRTNKVNSAIYLNPEALKHFIEMSEVANSETGLELTITSGYRSYEDQEKEYEQDQKRIKEQAALGIKVMAKAAPPGYSEHHNGYTIDLANNGNMGNRDKWLEKNAKYFGFERSYPANAQGVIPESWHWRFNPQLLEQYKKENDELVKKYIPDPSSYVKDVSIDPKNNVL